MEKQIRRLEAEEGGYSVPTVPTDRMGVIRTTSFMLNNLYKVKLGKRSDFYVAGVSMFKTEAG